MVWLLVVALLPAYGPIRFYFPEVEFPTEVSCSEQAARVLRDYSDDTTEVRAVCWFHLVPLPR